MKTALAFACTILSMHARAETRLVGENGRWQLLRDGRLYFVKDGARLAAVDAMQEIWTGKAPANRCPEMKSLVIHGAASGAPGATLRAKLVVSRRTGSDMKSPSLTKISRG